MTEEIRNVVIIGAGPSGLTAAIYASRAGLKPLMIEGYISGGQLMLTTEVENFPGFPEGIMGPKLIADMKKQAEHFGLEIISKDVTEVDFSQKPFIIKIGDEEIKTKTVIISTGASARWLGLDSEKKMVGRGVSSCATCDGAFYKDKEVIVVGGGDSAMEEAIFLTRFASKVTVVHRREELRASKIMQGKAKNNKKINFVWNTEVRGILGEEKVTGIKIKNNKTNEESEISCSGVFVAIGHVPNTKLFVDKLDLDEKKYIITKGKSTATSVSGVFACGDVQDYIFRQAITAAGSGCKAAIEAERYIEHSEE
jgi:thioredoxin reductase (NADPH)